MTLQEMFERVLINSGQFQYPVERIELNEPAFKVLVEMCIGIYNGYVPISKELFVPINTARQYTFTEQNTPGLGAPEWISKIMPTRIAGVVPYYFKEYNSAPSNVSIKAELPFEYRKPVLTVPVSADYEITAIYDHKLVAKIDTDKPTWEVLTISDNQDEFMDLLTGKFLIGLGRSRRAFTLNDMPITTDASDLVSEGKELEKEAMDELKEEKGRWYLAWGG